MTPSLATSSACPRPPGRCGTLAIRAGQGIVCQAPVGPLKLFGGINPGAETSRLMMDLVRVDRSGPEEPGPILGVLLRTTMITSCVLAACLGLLVVLVLF